VKICPGSLQVYFDAGVKLLFDRGLQSRLKKKGLLFRGAFSHTLYLLIEEACFGLTVNILLLIVEGKLFMLRQRKASS
jgi:hypothetical protein